MMSLRRDGPEARKERNFMFDLVLSLSDELDDKHCHCLLRSRDGGEIHGRGAEINGRGEGGSFCSFFDCPLILSSKY